MSREYDPGFRAPSPDFGAINAFEQSVVSGFNTNFTGSGYRALKYWALKNSAAASARGIKKRNESSWLDKETFDKDYSVGGKLKFDPHFEGKMSKDYAKSLMDDHLNDEFTAMKGALSYAPISSFVGSISGGLLSPVDLAINMAVPEFAIARFGLAASVASRSGTGAARMVSRTLNGAVNGTAQSMAFQAPMAAIASYNQTEYGLSDVISNIAMGPLIGGAAGFLHGAARHAFGEWDRSFANAVMHAAATDKDPTMAAKIASSDPRVQEAVASRQRVKDLITREKRTPEEDAELIAMAGENPSEKMNEATAILTSRRRESNVNNRKIIDGILANPNDKRIRLAESDDERFLAEAWKTLWGVELNYVHPDLGRQMGFRGFTRPNDPSKAYIVAGALNDGSVDSMMFIAGHELGHSVRLRDPALWTGMVDAMMKTSGDEDGALAHAWLTVVRHSRGNSVWAGLSINGKMDETFASVLGRAMQSNSFWRSLHQNSPAVSGKLSSYIFGLRSKLEGLLTKNVSPATRALHQSLSASLLAADAEGRRLTDKHVTDPVKLVDLYANYRPGFKKLTRAMSEEMNKRGIDAAIELSLFVEWNNDMFPEVATLSDSSASGPGRFATIIKGRRINSNNPGLWVLQNVFSKSKSGTPEHDLAKKFAERTLAWDRKSRRSDGGKDYVKSAIGQGPLAAFKKNADGTWDIGIYRNDDFPKWHEVFDNMPPDIELVSSAYAAESLQEMKAVFDRFVHKKEGPLTLEQSEPSLLFDEYLSGLGMAEIDRIVAEDPNVLWLGYAEHLQQKLSEFLEANNGKDYNDMAEHIRQLDPLLDPGNEKHVNAPDPAELVAAWNKFRKDYPAIKDKLNERNIELSTNSAVNGPLAWGVNSEQPVDFFKGLFNEVRQEVLAEVSEVRQMMDRLRFAKEGNFGLADGKGRSFFARDSAKLDARMEAAIDEIAHQRIRDSGLWPQYDKAMKLAEAVEEAAGDTISLSTVNPNELPAKYRDASEQFGVEDPMAEFSLDDSFMAAAPEDVREAAVSRKLSLEEANRLTLTRLDREHAIYSKYLTSYESSADALINEGVKGTPAEGFTLDLKTSTPLAEGKTAPSGPLFDGLEKVKSDYHLLKKQLDDIIANKQPKGDAKEVSERFAYHKRQELDNLQARDAVAADLRRAAQAKALTVINDLTVARRLKNLSDQGLDTVFSSLDGSPRKDVKNPGNNVSEFMVGRSISDTAPLIRELIDTGLDQAWRINDETLLRGVIAHLKGQESTDPFIKRIADTLRKSQEVQTGRLNSLGANIRHLEGHAFGQTHNPYAIKAGDVDYISDLSNWIDWAVTEKIVGPNAQGTDGNMIFDRGLYLKQLQFELSKTEQGLPNFDPETQGGNIANRVSQRRTLYFKGTHAFDYDMKYGSGNTSGLIIQQLVKRAEYGVVMENFGHDYKKTWGALMTDLGRSKKWQFSKIGRVDLTFKNLVGDLNHPENMKLAAMGQAVRQATNSVALWMTSISSITDIGNVTAGLTWMGVSPKDINFRLVSAMKDQVGKGPKERQFLLAQGAAAQAILSAFSRTQLMSGPLYRWAQKASDFTFRYNGQEIWTKTLQSAFHDLSSQHLGNMARADMTPEFANWLSHYDITQADWKTMAKHATEIDGLDGVRLAPDLIENQGLADKLRMALIDSMHQSILEPSVSNKAMLTGGFAAGTPAGEAIRLMTQYKGYPLAMVTRIQRRFSHAYGNDSLTAFGSSVNRAQIDYLIWSGSMIALATTALSIKDVLRGREPLNPFDTDQWSIGNVARIVSQAGVGPFSAFEQFLSPHQALGPLPGSIYSLASGVAAGNGYRTTNAVMGLIPGSSIAPIKESAKAILGSIFTETYGMHYQAFLARNEFETGQSSIFLDK